MEIIQRVTGISRRITRTLATATTELVLDPTLGTITPTASSDVPAAGRQAVNVTNCDTSANLYLKVSPRGTVPTVSSTDYDFKLSAGQDRSFQIGRGVSLYMRSDAAGSITVNIVEFI